MDILSTLVAIVMIIIVLVVIWSETYWMIRGVPYRRKDLLIGDTLMELKKLSRVDFYMENYNYAKSRGYKHMGRFMLFAPLYYPIDLNIIKHILQIDFNNFVNRGLYVNEKDDPVSAHLINLEDDKWRNLRTKLTPTFTTGKMKMGLPLLLDCSKHLIDLLKDHSSINDPVDIKSIVSRFTTDVIGSFGFGIDFNTLKNPDSDFYLYGKMIFDPPFRFAKLRLLLLTSFPRRILQFFRINKLHPLITNFFMTLTKQTVEYREKNNVIRKDFLHMLIELKNKGKVTDDDTMINDINDDNKPIIQHTLTIEEIAAQCYIFFSAGFETSATTLTFGLLELAMNQDIQDKLREDIVTILSKHNQEITYESILEMKYLDKFIKETLRRHPPVAFTLRICNNDYKVPDTDVTLESGTRVIIPIQGIHRDPEYYHDPDSFDPERFNEENKAKRPAFAYMPFGEGPRKCIASRFAIMQVKVGLISIIQHFRFTVNQKTQIPIRCEVALDSVNKIKGGVWLNLKEI